MEILRPGFWPFVTRFGEAQILLPGLALLVAWAVWQLKAHGTVLRWTACVAAAALITTVTKLAFIGWGVGHAGLDFTGISGHAMFAAAVLPLLLVSAVPPRARPAALAMGILLAALIAWSRVPVQAHSVSEVIAGFLLGSAASALALRWGRPPERPLPPLLLAGLLLWLAVLPNTAPPSPTHRWVTRIALHLAGHDQPYTREQLHRDAAAR